jgi:hypothetical protein
MIFFSLISSFFLFSRALQDCQTVYFQTKNPNLGKFWRGSDWKMLINFRAIWNTLRAFGIFYDHWVHFVFVWYILVSCTKKNLATLGLYTFGNKWISWLWKTFLPNAKILQKASSKLFSSFFPFLFSLLHNVLKFHVLAQV